MEAVQTGQLKHEINLLALALIVYTLVTYAVVTGDLLLRILLDRVFHNPFTEGLLLAMGESDWSQIAAVAAGIFVIALFSRGSVSFSSLFRIRQRIPFTVFVEVLCVFSAFQLVALWLDELLEYCLNLIGFTLADSIEQATASSSNPSQLLYACVAAPLAEEIIYRGFCLRRLLGRGRVFAIVLSALLFGVMHANLAQMLFAFLVGLVLGFVAAEYSVVYAIVLHVINNFVFGDLFSYAYDGAPDELFSFALYFLFGMLFFCAVLVLLQRRKEIVSYVRANAPEKGSFRHALTAALLLVFIVMNVALSLFLITPLQT